MSEVVKIANLASTYGIGVQFHTCGGPIATAATLQVEAAISNFLIHEGHEINLKPDNYHSSKFHYQPADGYYQVSNRPGIGQELSEKAMESAEMLVVE
ncbi:enolase C-terminal domain-like protein [Lactobacillus sp. 3B(2020)]|uniref:enolase C-terminal domain-like protein n=1 Tax=Lactobacillus sp. 3B(2020) TaxID=2695882 RepID=UPI0021047A01|nr:enolase C-terminal domain-like protein [Lactobacillus sp. 3B(2020)]